MALIDREETINFILTDMKRMSWNQARNDAINGCVKRLKKVPAVDAVPVVRCKVCKFIIDRDDGTHGCYKCFLEECETDDFCSYGVLDRD